MFVEVSLDGNEVNSAACKSTHAVTVVRLRDIFRRLFC